MTQSSQQALPPGTRIGSYEIESELGAGGFAITYKAFDHELQTHVAIKEYLPAAFAVRESDSLNVSPRSQQYESDYAFGLKGFLAEARTLAQFRDARIVRVRQFLEANGTAYLVMEYEDGESLEQLLRAGRAELDEPALLSVMIPILEGLAVVHRSGVLHRDVKPGNIYLRSDGSPVLIDFGAARHALGEHSQHLTSIVTPGYGPFEQYQSRGRQGPWTDLYSIGATLYRMVAGRRPEEAPDRIAALGDGEGDPNPPAVEVGRGRYSPALLHAIDWMLRPRIEDRPQTVEQVLEAFAEPATAAAPTDPTVAVEVPIPPVPAPVHAPAPAPAPAAAAEPAHDEPTARLAMLEPGARHQWVAGVALGLGAALVLTGAAFLVRDERAPEDEAPAPVLVVVDPAEAAREAERSARVADLLARGDAAREDDRLTTPENDSAMYYYQQVLSLDPGNEAGEEGIRLLVARYVELAEAAYRGGDVEKKDALLERGWSISPNDPELIAARARMAPEPGEAAIREATSSRGPIRKLAAPNVREAKQAYQNGRISRAEYRRLERYYEKKLAEEVRVLKAQYRQRRITRSQYDRAVADARRRYRG